MGHCLSPTKQVGDKEWGGGGGTVCSLLSKQGTKSGGGTVCSLLSKQGTKSGGGHCLSPKQVGDKEWGCHCCILPQAITL